MYRVNERLKALRIAAGFKTAKDFSDFYGFTQQTYGAHERGPEAGGRGLKRGVAETYVDCLKDKLPDLTVDWLLFGEGTSPIGSKAAPGLSEDAVPFAHGVTVTTEKRNTKTSLIEVLYPGHPNADVWEVETRAMNMEGILPGDLIITDLGLAPEVGDVVLAQQTDPETGKSQTLLRRYDPPYLIAHSTDAIFLKPVTVDNVAVIVMAVVVGKAGKVRKTAETKYWP